MVDQLMYCNKPHITAEARAYLRPNTQRIIPPHLKIQVLRSCDTSATETVFPRCHHQKRNRNTIEYFGRLKKADMTYSYWRCCVGTYLSKGLRRNTKFLTEYFTPRQRLKPSTLQLLLQTCYHYTNLSANFEAYRYTSAKISDSGDIVEWIELLILNG